ncbi:EAL domain-containing protein [Deinococcus malanensis]|uniref:EAL domain-containing protein n=1 Tax=Deinococcus malanensis TaxID=1706855 RepID=UPI0036332BF6
MTLLTGLHHALERCEFRLHYQPIIHAVTGVVAGYEALIRWEGPDGLVSPAEFIPLAEVSGLIVPIGQWVLREAVRTAALIPLGHIAVNVSPLEFAQPHFVEYVARVLCEENLDPGRLLLEVTENSLLDPRRAQDVLQDLRTLGVRVALDDFGTGYSSLSALAGLPVEVLKIDRSFMAQVGQPGPEACGPLNWFVLSSRWRAPLV